MMNNEKITKYFKNLMKACSNNNVYSVKAIIVESGFDIDQIIEWASSNEEWCSMLDWCRTLCACNAEKAGLLKTIPTKMAFEYMYENKYGFPE